MLPSLFILTSFFIEVLRKRGLDIFIALWALSVDTESAEKRNKRVFGVFVWYKTFLSVGDLLFFGPVQFALKRKLLS